MNWKQAIRYCAKNQPHRVCQISVYDCNNEQHWIKEIDIKEEQSVMPQFQSESPYPFAAYLEPYTKNKKDPVSRIN